MTLPVRRALLVCLAGVLAAGIFATGYFFRNREARTRPEFHDMRVNRIPDLVSLVDPDDPAVRSLSERLRTPEAAYAHVRDRIRYVPMVPGSSPGEILRAEAASCLGKATLLCSLYRAMGIPSSNVRLIVGSVALPDRVIDHVWIDLEYNGMCLQQDPSGLLGAFEFGQFRGMQFTRFFVQEEDYCFNDEGFAVISQLNRFRRNM
ncbi:MAG: transglutaminase-like domain-containing protein [bacterium]|jgi:hypothetical protein